MAKLFNLSTHKKRRKVLRSSMPKGEILLWQKLKGEQLDFKFRRQYGVGKYIIDFYCPEVKLAIEVDGLTHEGKQEYDKKRQQFIESKGVKVIRFRSDEVMYDTERVIQQIHYVCSELINTPS